MKKIIILLICGLISISLHAQKQDSSKVDFKEVVYKDVKDVLKQLGETLKVGTEHVYEVLVRQQLVKSITYIILYIVAIISIIFFKDLIKKLVEQDDDYAPWYIALGFYTLLCVFMFFATVDSTVTGFINPEYGAIEKIIELLKK